MFGTLWYKYDKFWEFKDKFPRILTENVVMNYGRLITLNQSCGSVRLNIPPHIEVRVFQDSELKEVWSGNAEVVLDFDAGKKAWRCEFPDGDKHLATIKFVGNNVTLTMNQKSHYGKYKPYHSSKYTVISRSEWAYVVELSKIAMDLHEQYRKEDAEKD